MALFSDNISDPSQVVYFTVGHYEAQSRSCIWRKQAGLSLTLVHGSLDQPKGLLEMALQGLQIGLLLGVDVTANEKIYRYMRRRHSRIPRCQEMGDCLFDHQSLQ
jgi:hypothetical protein